MAAAPGVIGRTLGRLARTPLLDHPTEQEKFNNRHQVYLKKVLSALKGVNALLILGSGETRFELQNALEKNKMFNGIWVENKACKKINQRELEIETENHFNLHLS